MRIGFIGTGTMGNPAHCLIDAGHQVTVHDLRREATANLCDLGPRWAGSPRATAEDSDVVFTSLPGPAQVEQAALDPSTGILAGLKPGGAYIDMTTNAPGVVRRIADACRARGVAMLDAPVSGRPPGMTIMVGGAASTFATYRPVLASVSGGGGGARLPRRGFASRGPSSRLLCSLVAEIRMLQDRSFRLLGMTPPNEGTS
jgi:3-hydroxyisobutyrate dehydrogenase